MNSDLFAIYAQSIQDYLLTGNRQDEHQLFMKALEVIPDEPERASDLASQIHHCIASINGSGLYDIPRACCDDPEYESDESEGELTITFSDNSANNRIQTRDMLRSDYEIPSTQTDE